MIGVGLGITTPLRIASSNSLLALLDILQPSSTGIDLLIPDPQYWYQDVAATMPVTAEGQSIACWIGLFGNKYVQTTTARQPTATKFASGRWGVLFDGTAKVLASESSIMFSNDARFTILAGVHKSLITEDVSNYILYKGTSSTPGYFELSGRRRFLGTIGTALYGFGSRGTVQHSSAGAGESGNPQYAAPHTAVLSATVDIVSGVPGGAALRVNKAATTRSSSVNAGDPAVLDGHPITIGASSTAGGSAFSGIIGPLVIRTGPIPSEATISQCETIIASYLGIAI